MHASEARKLSQNGLNYEYEELFEEIREMCECGENSTQWFEYDLNQADATKKFLQDLGYTVTITQKDYNGFFSSGTKYLLDISW